MKVPINVMLTMYRLRIIVKITFFLSLFHIALAITKCNLENAEIVECSETEVCDESVGTCQCLPGSKRVNETYCVKTHSTPNYSSLVDNHGSGSLVAGILIPLFLIIFVVCGIYASRKYHIFNWIRNKMHQRNENYDEFMIGQDDDDPPLA